jgi:hypothetical protein
MAIGDGIVYVPRRAIEAEENDMVESDMVAKKRSNSSDLAKDVSAVSSHRTILPIPDRNVMGLTTFEATDPDTKFPPITPLRPPVGAAKVLVVLLDDGGFGASSAFGGPCQTPDYGPRGNEFSGAVNWVQIDIDAAAKNDHHLIRAKECFQLVMARQ